MSMESIGSVLAQLSTPGSRFRKGNTTGLADRPPTKLWLIAERVATATGTSPTRWLRVCRDRPQAVERALITLDETTPRNRAAYFTWLLKKEAL